MIKIITNSLGSGDWIIVEQNGSELFSGHRITTKLVEKLQEHFGVE
jgi:hypothetical protein